MNRERPEANQKHRAERVGIVMPQARADGRALEMVVVAAGTGGHVIPGLSIAKAWQEAGGEVSWLGTQNGMETRMVPASGIELHRMEFNGLRGKGALFAIQGGVKMIATFVQCWKLMRQKKPAVMLAMGGYLCVPCGLAARLAGVPLVLLNADSVLLLSNRILRPFAQKVLMGLPNYQQDRSAINDGHSSNDGLAAHAQKCNADEKDHKDDKDDKDDKARKCAIVGNPVRAEIAGLGTPQERWAQRSGALRILVLGGSLGAASLNQILPRALALLPASAKPWITHQCGAAHIQSTQEAWAATSLAAQVEVIPFIDDMAQALGAADIVVSRAGAMAVSEFCAAGVPAMLFPLQLRTTKHQLGNAKVFCASGAGWLFESTQGHEPASKIAALLGDLTREKLCAMAVAARRLAYPNATDDIRRALLACIFAHSSSASSASSAS